MSWFTTIVGYAAVISLACSGIPFAWTVWKAGRSEMSIGGILLIWFGMLGMFYFEVATDSRLPRLADFSAGALCWSIVLLYRLFPSDKPL